MESAEEPLGQPRQVRLIHAWDTSLLCWARPWHTLSAEQRTFHAPESSLLKWKSMLILTQPDTAGTDSNSKPCNTSFWWWHTYAFSVWSACCQETLWSGNPRDNLLQLSIIHTQIYFSNISRKVFLTQIESSQQGINYWIFSFVEEFSNFIQHS